MARDRLFQQMSGAETSEPAVRDADRVELGLAAVAGVLTCVLALPLMAQPWGGDTAIFEYIGRHWLDGVWPYGGAHDNKPPGIFYIHAISSAVFGRATWGYRLLELLAILGMAWVIGNGVEGGRRELRVATAAWLCCAFYLGIFDYWRTAQVELGVALACVAAWSVARKEPSPGRQLVTGALLGAAFMFKFTAVFVAIGVAAVAASGVFLRGGARRTQAVALALLRLGAGAALAVVGLSLPFIASGNFSAMWEALVPFNRFYLSAVDWKDPEAPPFDFWVSHAGAFAVCGAALAGAALWRARRGAVARAPLIEAAALLALSVASAVSQDKMLAYYWVVTVPFFAALVMQSTWALSVSPAARAAVILGLGALGVAATPIVARPQQEAWEWRPPTALSVWRASVAYLTGEMERGTYLERFAYLYSVAEADAVGEMIQGAASPGDTLCVHGMFMPHVYTVTGLSCPSRFFSDQLLGFIRDASEPPAGVDNWEDQHQRALEREPPTFVVLPAERSEVMLWNRRYEALTTIGASRVLRLAGGTP